MSDMTFENKALELLSSLDKRLAVLEERTKDLGQLTERVHSLELTIVNIQARAELGRVEQKELENLEKRLSELEKQAGVRAGTQSILLKLLQWAVPSGAALLSLAAIVFALARQGQ